MPSQTLGSKHCRIAVLMGVALWAVVPAAAPASASVQNADMLKAVEAWRGGDDLEAVRLWMPLAERGNADAQFNLGQAFKLGRGVAQDIAIAETWYRRAAQQGHLQAEDNLGLVLFASGQRVGAMHYIRRSAARGEARALFLLGTAHFNGDLAEQDWPRAYALIRRASETGLSLAASRVAELDELIPEDQRKQGLVLLARLHGEEEAARALAQNPTPANAAPTVTPAALNPTAMIDISPATMNKDLDKARLIEPEMQPTPRPKAGVSFTPPPLPAPTPSAAPIKTSEPAPADIPIEAQPSPAGPPASPRLIDLPPSEAPLSAEPAQPTREAAPQPTPTPAPAPAPVATAAPAPAAKATTGPWRLQLGAFSQSENAPRLWKQLSEKHPAIARRRPIITSSGRFTMLYAGAFTSRAEAANLCAELKSANQNCLIID